MQINGLCFILENKILEQYIFDLKYIWILVELKIKNYLYDICSIIYELKVDCVFFYFDIIFIYFY